PSVWPGREEGSVLRCWHGEDPAGKILASRCQQLALGMKRQCENWRGMLQLGGRKGRLPAIPDTSPVAGGPGTIAPVGAEEHPGDATREGHALHNFAAGEAADRDLALRGADSQVLSRGVPGGRADHAGVAGKG